MMLVRGKGEREGGREERGERGKEGGVCMAVKRKEGRKDRKISRERRRSMYPGNEGGEEGRKTKRR